MKRFATFFIGIVCAFILLVVTFRTIPYIGPFLKKLDLHSIDYRMKYSPQPDVSEAIKIVLVKDVTNLRQKLARFTRLISSEHYTDYKPKVIGFNYRFDTAAEEGASAGLSMANNMYYGYSFELGVPQSTSPDSNRDILPFRLELTTIGDETSHKLEAIDVQLPSHPYLATARGIGFVNVLPDDDGVYRRIPLFLRYQDNWYGSLALLMAMEYLDIESVDMTFYPGQYVEIVKKDGTFMNIPVNQYGEMLIDFAYAPGEGEVAPFETFFLEDILDWSDGPPESHPLRHLQDAVVLVGSDDQQSIPISPSYPLVGIHANFMNNILANHFVKVLPTDFTISLVILVGMLTGIVLPRRGFFAKFFVALVLIGLYALVAYGVFFHYRLLLPFVSPVGTICLTTLIAGVLIRRKSPVSSSESPHIPQNKEKKRKVKTTSDDMTMLEDTLLNIREELDRKSYRLRSKLEELRLIQEQGESGQYDYSRQVASLQKEIRAREIEIRSLAAREDELRRQFENLPFTDPTVAQIKSHTEQLSQVFAKYGFITQDDGILSTLARVEKIAKTPTAIVIQGEPGTGKKLLAGILREFSPRQNRPFFVVTCAGDMDMLEDDLFGHLQGAFPGATEHRLGLLRKADQGILVLEDVGNLSLEIQTRLLQTCRGKAVRPLGDDHAYPSDVRVIATTSSNLKEQVSAGQFREDLYHHVSLFPVHLPPLRDRKEDIPALVNYFVTRYNQVHSRILETVSDAAIHLLLRHQWPGNITELEKVIERAVAESNPGEKELTERHITLEEADLSGGIKDPGMLTYLIALMDSHKELPAYQPLREKVLAEIQRLYCVRLLRKHKGDVKNASVDAGLKVETFKKMLTELMIEPEHYQY